VVFRDEGPSRRRQQIEADPQRGAEPDQCRRQHAARARDPRVGRQTYRGHRAAIRRGAPRARDFVNRRYRQRGVVDQAERARNRTKSKVRAKVEHSIGVIKRVFGFAKVRYRGLKKNAHRLIVACALANLFIARRHLLRWQEA
jgi:transposase, IS5 family